jgi:hypothetical protein
VTAVRLINALTITLLFSIVLSSILNIFLAGSYVLCEDRIFFDFIALFFLIFLIKLRI